MEVGVAVPVPVSDHVGDALELPVGLGRDAVPDGGEGDAVTLRLRLRVGVRVGVDDTLRLPLLLGDAVPDAEGVAVGLGL